MNIEDHLTTFVNIIEDKKGKDPIALDLRNVSLIADYFLICHGTSETQVKTLATEIKEKAEELGITIKRMEGLNTSRWVLIDLGDIVVHVFHREEREYYHLERLWSDAKVVEFK